MAGHPPVAGERPGQHGKRPDGEPGHHDAQEPVAHQADTPTDLDLAGQVGQVRTQAGHPGGRRPGQAEGDRHQQDRRVQRPQDPATAQPPLVDGHQHARSGDGHEPRPHDHREVPAPGAPQRQHREDEQRHGSHRPVAGGGQRDDPGQADRTGISPTPVRHPTPPVPPAPAGGPGHGERHREVDQGSQGRPAPDHHRQPTQAVRTPREDGAHHQPHGDQGDGNHEDRVDGHDGHHHQGGDQHVGPQAAESGTRAGLPAPDPVGRHGLGTSQASGHPGHHGEGGQRRQPSSTERVVGNGDRQVDQHGHGP